MGRWDVVGCHKKPSLQNRRDFLRKQRRKRGEREARVAREGRRDFLALLPSRATRASRSPRVRLAFASVYAKNHACSAGYKKTGIIPGKLGSRAFIRSSILTNFHTHRRGTKNVVIEGWIFSVSFCDFSHSEYYIYTLNDVELT